MAEAGQNGAQNLAEAGQYGEKGLQCVQTATKPDGTVGCRFPEAESADTGIFNGVAGMAAYQAKDYAKAQQYLRAAVEADPPDATVCVMSIRWRWRTWLPGPTERRL